MTKEHTLHKCDQNESGFDVIFLLGSWCMDDGHDGYIDIDFCPWCGKKLENFV